MAGWKALAIISIIALQIMLIYPYISGPAGAIFTNIASSIGLSGENDSIKSDVSSGDLYEYRAEIIMYRDRLSSLLEGGMVPPSIATEVRSLIDTLTDEKISKMNIYELKMAEEEMEYYLKILGLYESNNCEDYCYKSMDVDSLRYKIYEALGEAAEYRAKAKLYSLESANEKLERAEQLLNEALNMINTGDVDLTIIRAAWGRYFEAKILIESVEHQIEYLYDE